MTKQKSQGSISKLKLNKHCKIKKPWSFTWLEWWATPEPIGPAMGCGCGTNSTEVCCGNSLVLLSCACTPLGKPAMGWYWGYVVCPTTGWLNWPWYCAGAAVPSVGGTDICMMAGSFGSETLFSTRMSLISDPRNKM